MRGRIPVIFNAPSFLVNSSAAGRLESKEAGVVDNAQLGRDYPAGAGMAGSVRRHDAEGQRGGDQGHAGVTTDGLGGGGLARGHPVPYSRPRKARYTVPEGSRISALRCPSPCEEAPSRHHGPHPLPPGLEPVIDTLPGQSVLGLRDRQPRDEMSCERPDRGGDSCARDRSPPPH